MTCPSRQAELLAISRGAMYLPRPVGEADLALVRHIEELHLEHPFMGARMLRNQLQRGGVHVGRRHISTLMQRMGVTVPAPQPGTSKPAPGHHIYPYLLRKLAIRRSNQVWALDITYIQMARGFVYRTAVVDVASRRVLANRAAITLEANHAKEVIQQALAQYLRRRSSTRSGESVHGRGVAPTLPCLVQRVSAPHSSLDRLTPDESYFADAAGDARVLASSKALQRFTAGNGHSSSELHADGSAAFQGSAARSVLVSPAK